MVVDSPGIAPQRMPSVTPARQISSKYGLRAWRIISTVMMISYNMPGMGMENPCTKMAVRRKVHPKATKRQFLRDDPQKNFKTPAKNMMV